MIGDFQRVQNFQSFCKVQKSNRSFIQFTLIFLVYCYQLVATKYIITYNLQNKFTTAAMSDQEMEDLVSQVNFFRSIARGFIKLKQVQLPVTQRFLSDSIK